jgi:hypothetical protein
MFKIHSIPTFLSVILSVDDKHTTIQNYFRNRVRNHKNQSKEMKNLQEILLILIYAIKRYEFSIIKI